MRIISGQYKGRILAEVPEEGVRPATDRVRTTIFNMLQNRLDLYDAKVLDVFAGTGSLGLEAISRGASKSIFVEINNYAIDNLENNIEILGCQENAEIIHSEAEQFLSQYVGEFDLIFADPPYAYDNTVQLPEKIFSRNLLKKDGILIIEHSNKTKIPASTQYRCSALKEFGQTNVSFFVHPE